ncbi:protein phosphatase 2C domain-containing protein [Streptomyces solisilvae]|uniref:protein phosphatase 2C domain-containing protein n=1 Tax=Streptomyces malaysiensis TaxID=92644 RepID=UPI00321FCE95|nr:protein phosphatase 2C domain-containing protein [Streptomyces malaysiensis]
MNSHSIAVQAALIPKKGSSRDECEDAFCVDHGPSSDRQRLGAVAVAISDGATESIFAKKWAGMITRHAADSSRCIPDGFTSSGGSFRHFIRQIMDSWESWVSSYVKQRIEDGRPLRWYEEAKLASGAFATLLAVHFEEASDGIWHAAAIGDSCLFQIRNQRVIDQFPVQSSADFGVSPDLLGSRADPDAICERTYFARGSFACGDEFFLMTDALAAWFVSTIENATPSQVKEALDKIKIFSRSENRSTFESWLSAMIINGKLRNDDITLIRIRISE